MSFTHASYISGGNRSTGAVIACARLPYHPSMTGMFSYRCARSSFSSPMTNLVPGFATRIISRIGKHFPVFRLRSKRYGAPRRCIFGPGTHLRRLHLCYPGSPVRQNSDHTIVHPEIAMEPLPRTFFHDAMSYRLER